MASVFTAAEITARIATLKLRLTAVDTAITAVLSGATEYSLDTGQSRISTKKTSLRDLQQYSAALLAELQRWQDMSDGGGTAYYRASW